MKLKNFIRNKALKKDVLESASAIAPVYSKYYTRFKSKMQKRPKKTMAILLFIATANFMILLFVVNHSKKPTIGLAYQKTKMVLFNNNADVNFSIPNYFKMKELKDSLELVMHKEKMTKDDTLLLIRIYQQYATIDPDFFKQLNKYTNEKKSTHP